MTNVSVIIGRLVRDPELRYTNSGKPVAKFSVAVNETYVSNGKKVESVSYIPCEAWNSLAENLAKYCQKGREISVTGSLKQERWTVEYSDGTTGNESRLIIRASSIQYLGSQVTEKPAASATKVAKKKKVAKATQQPAEEPVVENAEEVEMPEYA